MATRRRRPSGGNLGTDAESVIMRKFDSVGAFVSEAVKRASKSGASHHEGGHRGDWTGTRSFNEAVTFATQGGWEPKVAAEFRRLFDQLLPKLRKFTDMNMERFMDTSGCEVDVAAYVTGEPEHMTQWVPEYHEVQKRALCLLVGASVDAGVTADDLFLRGQAVVALVRSLSLLGFELEIWSEQTVGGADELYSILVRVHAAGSIVDQSAIEFACGNPSWLRRLMFGFEEGEPTDIREAFGFNAGRGGYGRPTSPMHQDIVGADITVSLGRDWYDHAPRGGSDTDKAMGWVVAQLKELGALPEDADVDWETQ